MAAQPEDPEREDGAASDAEADTLADGDWPVPALYDVHPDEAGSLQGESDARARPGRRFPPRVAAASLLVVVALLAVLGAVALAAWSSSSDDDPVADAAPQS